MQLISEKIGQEIGRVPNRLDRVQDASSIGIDFLDVAESHVLFFGHVKDFIVGEPPEFRDLSEISRCCDLERWLQGTGASRFGELSAFGRLCTAHTEFHFHAAEVLAKIQAGNRSAAEQVRKRELSQALRLLLIAVTDLNESIKKLREASAEQDSEPGNMIGTPPVQPAV